MASLGFQYQNKWMEQIRFHKLFYGKQVNTAVTWIKVCLKRPITQQNRNWKHTFNIWQMLPKHFIYISFVFIVNKLFQKIDKAI